ncbi:Immunoprevalent protein [NY_014 poxvirus]|uniref:Immunoprevalent protein n=1 Tax=NY_014 poxvirus TaxID=2025360 RepID=UPI000B99FBC4|nr:Immunoprevalent protein [NY_014 poxvirus]AST09560.1 Immunoprevalent protein [NY_014 poxvirus]
MGNKHSEPVFSESTISYTKRSMRVPCNEKPSTELKTGFNRLSLREKTVSSLQRGFNRLSLNEKTFSLSRGFNNRLSLNEKTFSLQRGFSLRRFNSVRGESSNSKLMELKKEIYETIQQANDMDIDKRIKLLYNIKSMMGNSFMLKGLIDSLETLEPTDGISYSSVMILGEFSILDQYTDGGKSTFKFVINLLKSLDSLNHHQQKLIEYAVNNDILYDQITMIEYIMKNNLDMENRQFILKGKYTTPLFIDLLKHTGINVISNVLIWNKKYTKSISNLYTAMRLLYSITV